MMRVSVVKPVGREQRVLEASVSPPISSQGAGQAASPQIAPLLPGDARQAHLFAHEAIVVSYNALLDVCLDS